MRFRKRWILEQWALAGLAVLVAACGGPGSNGGAPDPAEGSFSLTITVQGPGAVEAEDLELTCSDECTALVGAGANLELIAQANGGNGFVGWQQDCAGNDPSCSVEMRENLTVRAVFAENVLGLQVSGDGRGSVRVVPPDVICVDDCSQGFETAVNASLTVTLEEGSAVKGWGGACSGESGRYCQIPVAGQVDVALTLVRPPSAADDAYEVNEDSSLVVSAADGVLSNDSDSANDTLRAELESQPTKGTIALKGDGSFSYSPRTDENGPDSFRYRAYDTSDNRSQVATVSILIQAVDEPLGPVPVETDTLEDSSVTMTLQASGGASGARTYSIVSSPSHGTVSLAGDEATYRPDPNFWGEDEFEFQVRDSAGKTATETAAVVVTSVNDAPSFRLTRQSVSVAGDSGSHDFPDFAVEVSPGPANESAQQLSFRLDPVGGDSLSFSEPPSMSVAGATGSLSFAVAEGSYGSAEFDVMLVDDGGSANGGQNESAVQSLTITVSEPQPTEPEPTQPQPAEPEPANSAPVAEDDSLSTGQDMPVDITLRASDVDGDVLEYRVTVAPSDGALSGTAPELTYTSESGFSGNDLLRFVANDGTEDSNEATVEITVEPSAAEDDTESSAEGSAAGSTVGSTADSPESSVESSAEKNAAG
ncbi:MAG: Ig-like domain-containing protein [Trueperaceae bacterium]